MEPATRSKEEWINAISQRLGAKEKQPLEISRQALEQHPGDGVVLEFSAVDALVEERPDICVRYLKRLHRRYLPKPQMYALQAIAFFVMWIAKHVGQRQWIT